METRVYAVDNHNGERKPWSIDDESFISEAETAGTVWSLAGFEVSLNMGLNPNLLFRFLIKSVRPKLKNIFRVAMKNWRSI